MVQRKDTGYNGQQMPSGREGGRPQRRCMDVMKEEMKMAGVREEDGKDRVRWRQIICFTGPKGSIYYRECSLIKPEVFSQILGHVKFKFDKLFKPTIYYM